MKRPFAESFPDADDASEPTLMGRNMHLDQVASPFHPHSDSEFSDSDDPKKPRKKRSAYQKIADDVRMKLLECVKNGETLKSAAKRFKINYSSAKSILHTFRKEGRILKKSAQERTTKKKINAENEHPYRPQKQVKKETTSSRTTKSTKVDEVSSFIAVGKPTKESNPLNSRKNSNCAAFLESQDQIKTVPMRKGSEFLAQNYDDGKPTTYSYDSYSSMIGGDVPQHTNFMFFPQNESFQEMSSGFHNNDFAFDTNSFLFTKTADLHFLMDDKMQKMDGGVFEENNGYDMGTLKNYMDTQNVYRTAIRKASFFSSTSNGCRKSSFDMY